VIAKPHDDAWAEKFESLPAMIRFQRLFTNRFMIEKRLPKHVQIG